MDYCDITSVQAGVKSYMEALEKLLAICPKIEPSANEGNHRVVLPTCWSPELWSKEDLRSYANTIVGIHTDDLFNFGTPRVILPNYTMWKEDFFSVQWGIQFPFNLYRWEIGQEEYTNPNGKVHKAVPTSMKEWCSPQYVILTDSWRTRKSWGLKDWRTSATFNEVCDFFKGSKLSEKDLARYQDAVLNADRMVDKWKEAIAQLQTLKL